MDFNFESLRICFIAGTLGQGGAERQLFYILKALQGLGSDISLLSLTKGEFWEERIRDLGIPVVWVGRNATRMWRFARMLSELRKLKPDVVQSQHFFTNTYAAMCGRVLGFRSIGAIRNDAISEIHDTGQFPGRVSLRLPRLIAANSMNGLANAVDLGLDTRRVVHLPNVVDTDDFLPAVRRRGGPVTILAVGRFERQKRFDRLLTVLPLLKERTDASLRALIVGSGPELAGLQKRARESNLFPGIVQFLPHQAKMADVYRESDILVLTSDWEGTPNVVLEAMASGLPVVATAVGGVPEIVRDGITGFLVSPDDTKSTTDRLLELVCNASLREEMGRAARKDVEQNHSLERLPEFLARVYSTLYALNGQIH